MLRHRRHLPAQRGLRVEKIVPWLLGLLACCKMRFGAKVGTSQRASVRWPCEMSSRIVFQIAAVFESLRCELPRAGEMMTACGRVIIVAFRYPLHNHLQQRDMSRQTAQLPWTPSLPCHLLWITPASWRTDAFDRNHVYDAWYCPHLQSSIDFCVFLCLCIFLFPQDVENISPVADKITRRDVEKLPMDELRKRANTLTQKLERRSLDCIHSLQVSLPVFATWLPPLQTGSSRIFHLLRQYMRVGSLTQSKESSNAWPCVKPCRTAKTGGMHYAHSEAAAAKPFLAFSVSLGSFSGRLLRDAVENYALWIVAWCVYSVCTRVRECQICQGPLESDSGWL